ncbi:MULTISPECIES: 30S ribosome-binding factor RbfA [unclassified Cyanobium]|uniref:30S ribosome-binding factor RbfA n=1 Tax=unclassified Cyanobium TaxID=2627006 RepID=UPI0020CCB504|nr:MULTISPECIES: 30S ribosome-binding factor RbfA [unclassified Cyanobium]MCP9835528.1 30S ribosome-binding factor RbfA [Cyanobium sp. La Preciosa 7G6]MCP9938294.1 30S ribosome-binding factor RbfA [Cyanobium sp. Aljojuca 7A6]
MAQSRRVERVAALIRREVSELLMSGIKDERVQHGMVSVTSVEVAGDLQHCKIFVSIFGSAEDQEVAMDGLKAASVYVKGELGRRLKMRRTPEVAFVLDRGLEKGNTVLGLLQRLEAERRERGGEEGEEPMAEAEPADPAGDTDADSETEA